jgi:multicomponent Na+:H+ antiporter subunit E
VVRQVLDPRAPLRQAVVAVPVVGTSDQLLTLLADAVSLTPGTLALEIDRPAALLYVHVLDLGGEDGGVQGVRRSIMRMERLILQALGPAEQVQRALDAERAAAREVAP